MVALLIIAVGLTPCTESEPDDLPCVGILMPVEFAREAVENKIGLRRCQELSSHQAEVGLIELQAVDRRIKACETARASAEELARQAVKATLPLPWYQKPVFAASVGFVAGIVLGLTARAAQ